MLRDLHLPPSKSQGEVEARFDGNEPGPQQIKTDQTEAVVPSPVNNDQFEAKNTGVGTTDEDNMVINDTTLPQNNLEDVE